MAHYGVKAEGPKVAKSGKKRIDHQEIRKGAEGGHIVEHHYDNSGMGPYSRPDSFPFGADQGKEALAHVAEHMGIKASDEERDEKDV